MNLHMNISLYNAGLSEIKCIDKEGGYFWKINICCKNIYALDCGIIDESTDLVLFPDK